MNFRLIYLCKGIGQIQANLKDYNNHICEIDVQTMRPITLKRSSASKVMSKDCEDKHLAEVGVVRKKGKIAKS